MKHRRPFLLLEVLIALALVSFCVIPLMRTHYTLSRREAEAAREIEIEQHSLACFEKIREKLYKNEIPWFKRNQTYEGVIDNTPYTVSVAKQYPKGRDQHYRVYRILEISLPHDKTYLLFAEKVKN